ncbi:MAG: ABC transporter permease [Deltaproteobacteria bacterium]|nr:ABC transporter permease [Deltaproteobacteria bacterium]
MGTLGSASLLTAQAFRSLFRRPFELRQILAQMEELGLRSLTIAILTATFTGMVMSLQFAWGLGRFGAKEYVGRVIGISIARELGPVLTALMVGGRIGSGMAAELGSMAVTEQIDAIRALGADPIKKLVMPRVIASILVLPLLTVVSDLVAFAGAALVAESESGVTAEFFLSTALQSMKVQDFTSGIGKSFVFGYIIAIVGCRYGLVTSGGTESVGNSTTRTVVVTSIFILMADFLLTKLFMIL